MVDPSCCVLSPRGPPRQAGNSRTTTTRTTAFYGATTAHDLGAPNGNARVSFKCHRSIQAKMRSGNSLSWVLALFGVAVLIGLIALTSILVPPAASAEGRNAFFGGAMQVSSTLLVAVFIVAARVLSEVRDKMERAKQLKRLVANILLVFVGLMIGAFGLLSPSSTGVTNLVFSLFLTWFVALFLMFQGLAADSGRPVEN